MKCSRAIATLPNGLIFANLVDFDTQYGHRNDVTGYAANLERDARLPQTQAIGPRDLLFVTADHRQRIRPRPARTTRAKYAAAASRSARS